MRIISGHLKGRRIIAPNDFNIRPTKDFLKEGIFNILASYYYFDKLSVLDLFSGTGNMAYEFASRGAQRIVAVEQNNAHSSFIKDTTKNLDLKQISVICSDAFSFIEKTTENTYDIIFADPPYDLEEQSFENISGLVFKKKLLKTNGCLIIEHSSRMDLSKTKNFDHTRKYGSSKASFFKPSDPT